MKKTRLLLLLGLILCLLLTAGALAENGASSGASNTFELNGYTLERLGENTSECRIIAASDDLIQNGVLVLPDKLNDEVFIVGYAPSVISESIRILVVPSNYSVWMNEEEAPDQKIEYYVIAYKDFASLNENELDRLPDIRKGEYALCEFFREVINRNGNTSRSWNEEDLLLGEDIPEEIMGAKAYNLIDPSRISKQDGDWVYIGRDGRYGEGVCLLKYLGIADKTVVIPDTLGDLPVYEYSLSVLPDDVEYVYFPDYSSSRYSGEKRSSTLEFYGISYISYNVAAEERSDLIRQDASFTKGTYSAVRISRYKYTGNDFSSYSVDNPLPAESLLSEINGSPLSLKSLSWNIYYTDGDWQYSSDGNENTARISAYAGTAETSLVVPETIGGFRPSEVLLAGIPESVEIIYLPYNTYLSSSRSSFGPDESRSIIIVRYISYENASEYSSSLYQDTSFTEGSYAGVEINKNTYTASGSNYDSNISYPADSFPSEINGKPFHLGNLIRNATYTSGDYTYSLSAEGELFLMNGIPTDKKNALFVPSFVEEKQVRYLSFAELPEGITEIYLPTNTYFYRSDFARTHDINLFYYVDYALTQSENGWYGNYDVLPGELILTGANLLKASGSSEKLVLDYYAYPTEINGLPIRSELNADYILTYTSQPYTYYKMSESEICITGFTDSETRKVNIPETIDSLTVAAISSLSNYNWVFDVSDATEITLPSTLKVLGNFALRSNKANKLTLPEGLVELGSNAINLYSLKDITFPSTLQRIGTGALSNTRIQKITVPANITSLPNNCFSGMWYLKTLELPAGMTTIPAGLCENCNNLGTVTLPEGITSIGENAFHNCSRLGSITIPSTVTVIDKNAFNNCSRLAKLKFSGTKITTIEESAFVDCKALSKLDLPEGVVDIKHQAFYGTKLSQLVLPSTVKRIESVAFGSCASLGKVTMGAGVEEIAADAFADCKKNLTVFAPEDSYAKQWAETNGFVFKPTK